MQPDEQAVPVSRKMIWAGRIISALPVLLMAFSAVMKLAKLPTAVAGFTKFGYPERLIAVLGIVELSCAIIYAIPRTSVLGAILVTGYFGGATATQVRIGDPTFVMPVLVGVFAWLGLLLRERRLRGLLPLRSV